jgi:tetratricopeptide (TPR) repeat protein
VTRAASQISPATLSQPALASERWELTLLAARGLAQTGNEREALALLRSVPATAAVRARARGLLGILLARRNELARARGALGEAVALFEKSPASSATRAQREHALVHLARADYAAGARATALTHYARLAAGSPFGPEAGLLRAASALEAKDLKRATEELHRLHGLRFSHGFFPEGLLLRAAIYLREGALDRSEEALKAFAGSFGELPDQLLGFARREKDPGEVLGALRRDLKSGGKLERRGATVVLADLRVEEAIRTVDLLDRELARLQSSPADWKSRAIAGVVLQDLTLQKSMLANEAGTLILRRMMALRARLRALAAEAERLRSAVARCRAAKQRATVKVSLQPLLTALFQPREGVEHHDLFALQLELGGCGAR